MTVFCQFLFGPSAVGLSQRAISLLATPVLVPQGPHLRPAVLQILARCDIMVLQEVVDSSGSALSLLLRELNR